MKLTPMEPDLAADAAALAAPTRQSPLAVLQIALTSLRQIGTVNLVVGIGFIVSGRLPSWALAIVPIGGLLLMAAAVASWWRFTFRATNEELVVTQGVLYKKELTIPFVKVQSVTVNEGVMQRIFGLVSASVDTAGSAATEFQIHGIERSQAESLRRLASRANPAASAPPLDSPATGIANRGHGQGERLLVERSPRDLMVLGLIGNPFAGFALLAGVAFFADDFANVLGIDLPELDDSFAPSGRQVVIGVVLSILALVVAWLALSLRNIVVNWNFRLTTRQRGLELSAGLLRRRFQASHISKVQSIGVTNGPLLRRAGFSHAILHTIGTGDFTIAGITDSELVAVRDLVGLPFAVRPSRRISTHYITHRLRLASLVAAIGAAGLAFDSWRLAPFWLLLPLFVGVQSWFVQRNFRWEVTSETIQRSTGKLFVAETEAPLGKSQTVRVTQSIYQRKRQLASVAISNAETVIQFPMLPASEAEAVRDLLLAGRNDRQPFDDFSTQRGEDLGRSEYFPVPTSSTEDDAVSSHDSRIDPEGKPIW